jgi:hypothetical protein
MKLFYSNLVDAGTTTLTASSEDVYLPVSNLANALRKRIYKSGTESDTTITIDLGAAYTPTAIILLDCAFGDNVPDFTLYSSPDNSTWTSRATWTMGGGTNTTAQLFAGVAVRYWKLVIGRDYDDNPITIGRMFFGTYYSATEPPDYDGVTITPTDPSVPQLSAGGQEYTDLKEHYDLVDLKFSEIPDEQTTKFRDVFASLGMAVPFFLLIENGFTKYYYVKFARNPQCKVSSFDGGFRWKVTINFKEQI